MIGYQEDEKAIQRLLALEKDFISQQGVFFSERKKLFAEFQTENTRISEAEEKSAEAGNSEKSESLRNERKDAFQSFCGKSGQLNQEEASSILQLAKEVEKAADRASLREESDKTTVSALMAWMKDLKDLKKKSSDLSQAQINSLLKVVEIREKAVSDFLSSKSKEIWRVAGEETQKILQAFGFDFFCSKKAENNFFSGDGKILINTISTTRKAEEGHFANLSGEVEKRTKEEEDRQKQRNEAIRQLQKEQTKRSKGKK